MCVSLTFTCLHVSIFIIVHMYVSFLQRAAKLCKRCICCGISFLHLSDRHHTPVLCQNEGCGLRVAQCLFFWCQDLSRGLWPNAHCTCQASWLIMLPPWTAAVDAVLLISTPQPARHLCCCVHCVWSGAHTNSFSAAHSIAQHSTLDHSTILASSESVFQPD